MLIYIVGYKFDLLGHDLLMFALLFSPALLIFALQLSCYPGKAGKEIIRHMGKISFSLFLWNIPIYAWGGLINKLLSLNTDYGETKVLVTLNVIIFLVSVLVYILFERRIETYVKVRD